MRASWSMRAPNVPLEPVHYSLFCYQVDETNYVCSRTSPLLLLDETWLLCSKIPVSFITKDESILYYCAVYPLVEPKLMLFFVCFFPFSDGVLAPRCVSRRPRCARRAPSWRTVARRVCSTWSTDFPSRSGMTSSRPRRTCQSPMSIGKYFKID